METADMTTKKLLNTMCTPQDISCKMPPHEQGISCPKASIDAIYSVNASMSAQEAYSPVSRNAGITSIVAITSSLAGTAHDRSPAIDEIKGDSLNPNLKFS